MPIVRGGRGNYGEAVGVLTLDTIFPRIPGDVGNATTFDFPVRFSVVRGASPRRVVHEQDPALLKPFIEAAQELEAAGCRAITTTCGFLALFQRGKADQRRVRVEVRPEARGTPVNRALEIVDGDLHVREPILAEQHQVRGDV